MLYLQHSQYRMTEIDTVPALDTVRWRLIQCMLSIPYDGDRYDIQCTSLQRSYDGDRYDADRLVSICFAIGNWVNSFIIYLLAILCYHTGMMCC